MSTIAIAFPYQCSSRMSCGLQSYCCWTLYLYLLLSITPAFTIKPSGFLAQPFPKAILFASVYPKYLCLQVSKDPLFVSPVELWRQAAIFELYPFPLDGKQASYECTQKYGWVQRFVSEFWGKWQLTRPFSDSAFEKSRLSVLALWGDYYPVSC